MADLSLSLKYYNPFREMCLKACATVIGTVMYDFFNFYELKSAGKDKKRRNMAMLIHALLVTFLASLLIALLTRKTKKLLSLDTIRSQCVGIGLLFLTTGCGMWSGWAWKGYILATAGDEAFVGWAVLWVFIGDGITFLAGKKAENVRRVGVGKQLVIVLSDSFGLGVGAAINEVIHKADIDVRYERVKSLVWMVACTILTTGYLASVATKAQRCQKFWPHSLWFVGTCLNFVTAWAWLDTISISEDEAIGYQFLYAIGVTAFAVLSQCLCVFIGSRRRDAREKQNIPFDDLNGGESHPMERDREPTRWLPRFAKRMWVLMTTVLGVLVGWAWRDVSQAIEKAELEKYTNGEDVDSSIFLIKLVNVLAWLALTCVFGIASLYAGARVSGALNKEKPRL